MAGTHEVVIESGVCMYAGVTGLEQAQLRYSEAKKVGKTPQGCLRVRLPVGYVDDVTANGNHYESKEIRRVAEELKPAMKAGLVHGAHGEHPKDRADLRPDEISHLITDMWVEDDIKVKSKSGKTVPTLWNEWLIVPTQKAGGADLIQLFLAGASIGTSIRGTAVREEEKYMRHYNFKGTDTVGVPSTGLMPGINNETMRASISYESVRTVQESDTLSDASRLISLISEGVTNMGVEENTLTTDLAQISESLKQLTEGKGGSDLLGLGVKIGALEGKIAELHRNGDRKDTQLVAAVESLSEVEKIKATLEAEKNQAVRELASYKKTVEELTEQVASIEKDLATEASQKQTAVSVIKELRDRYNTLLTEGVDNDDDDDLVDEDDVSILRTYSLKAEELIRFSSNYIVTLESALGQVKEYALSLEELVGHAAGKAQLGSDEVDKAIVLIENLRDLAGGAKAISSKVSVGMEAWIGHLLDKYPKLKHFGEELRECESVKQVEHRVSKYLDMIDKNALASFEHDTSYVSEAEKKDNAPRVAGIERNLGGWR